MTLLEALRLRDAVLKALPVDEDADRRVAQLLARQRQNFVSRKLTQKKG